MKNKQYITKDGRQTHPKTFFLFLQRSPSALPCLLGVWPLAINDDSDNKSYSDSSGSDKLWGDTSTYIPNNV